MSIFEMKQRVIFSGVISNELKTDWQKSKNNF